ncbi:MAG: DUF4185 domain-containing protein [Deltaproteobacteria bacterium]|nr:DUF4185 domain-containing protein [Deltaproteobacteria bacterium]
MNMGRDKLQIRKHVLPVLVVVAAIIAWWGCSALYPEKHRSSSEPYIAAMPWPEADRLFRCDMCWLGGDGAYSIDLGKQRVLWLFGDSFIDPAGSGDRNNASVVRNSIAIQRGYDPTTAGITFYWSALKHGAGAYFSNKNDGWFWPGSGARVGDTLIIFLVRIHSVANELGFEPEGSTGVSVKNPDSSPKEWNIDWPRIPKNEFDIIVGSAALYFDGFLYAFGTNARSSKAYLVRWQASDAAKGDLENMFWWSGENWCKQDRLDGKPSVLFQGAQMEYTVHYESSFRLFVQIQTGSFMDKRLTFRTAPEITGPWSETKPFYTPVEEGNKELLVYAGKAHSALSGSDLIFTYAVNSMNMDLLVSDKTLYYPVFVRGYLYREQ